MFIIKKKVVYRLKLNYGTVCCSCGKFSTKATVVGFAKDKDNDIPLEIIVGQECIEKYKIGERVNLI